MTYRIQVEQIGPTGTPFGHTIQHEAGTASEALAMAADEIGSGRSGAHCTATVLDPTGRSILVYSGRSQIAVDADGE